MWMLHKGHSGDGCDLASTLCRYDSRKGDLQSHDCLVGSHACLLLFTLSCCSECFYYL